MSIQILDFKASMPPKVLQCDRPITSQQQAVVQMLINKKCYFQTLFEGDTVVISVLGSGLQSETLTKYFFNGRPAQPLDPGSNPNLLAQITLHRDSMDLMKFANDDDNFHITNPMDLSVVVSIEPSDT